MTSGKLISIALAAALAVVAFAAVTAGSAGARSVATASSTPCNLTVHEQRHLGASYVTSLKVSHVSCKKGKKVIKAFHECRTAGGQAQGKCQSKVLGYSCTEHRFDAVPQVQYNSRVTCTRGNKVVKSTYTQNV
ncbi:MAG: hypothetical protein M3R23_04300 [Actinomycetota bacterium]|nr:hypothetical protein [Actinomycetota bacterium]